MEGVMKTNELFDKYTFEDYKCKEELRFRLDRTIDLNEFWDELIKYRKFNALGISFYDANNTPLWFNLTDQMRSNINKLEDVGRLELDLFLPFDLREDIINDVLVAEAISSSAIEGAFSTKKRVVEIIDNDLEPANKAEMMLVNNYYALEYILEHLEEDLSHTLIQNIWERITEKTLDEDSMTSTYRDAPVYVTDRSGNSIYEAPDHSQVEDMMSLLIDFFNDEDDDLPSVIKASIIHYYFVYVHPYFDGNGRTARALATMYLIKSDLNFFKYVSISSILKDKKGKYYKAIARSENPQGDITYFIDFYVNMLMETVNEMSQKYIGEYFIQFLSNRLAQNEIFLNKRQLKLLKTMVNNKQVTITVREYMKKYSVVKETARKDLLELNNLKLISYSVKSRTNVYKMNEPKVVIMDLESVIRQGSL